MLTTILKMLIFGTLTAVVLMVLYDHGSETVQYTLSTSNIDWPNLAKDLGLLLLAVFCMTGVKHAWDQRHQGSSLETRRRRNRNAKTLDNLKIPR